VLTRQNQSLSSGHLTVATEIATEPSYFCRATAFIAPRNAASSRPAASSCIVAVTWL